MANRGSGLDLRPWLWRVPCALGSVAACLLFASRVHAGVGAAAQVAFVLPLGLLGLAALLETDRARAGPRPPKVLLLTFAALGAGILEGTWAGWMRARGCEIRGVHIEACAQLFVLLPTAAGALGWTRGSGPEIFWPALAYGLGQTLSAYLAYALSGGFFFDDMYRLMLPIALATALASWGVAALRRRVRIGRANGATAGTLVAWRRPPLAPERPRMKPLAWAALLHGLIVGLITSLFPR